MNYRHAFHAGNFADCMKHALLLWLVGALTRKPAALFVLDTHAGAGRFDLDGGPARRTGEWQMGIGRLLEAPPGPLDHYLGLVRRLGLYPGSPTLVRALLRPQDRLACCELHPEEAAALRRLFARDRQVGVHLRDGWEALGALLPPSERRGLVLVDPPYERADDMASLPARLRQVHARFPTGVYAAWYPIKDRAPVRALQAGMAAAGVPDVVTAELLLREPLQADRLNGCGLLVVNPPYGFADAAGALLDALSGRLSDGPGGGWSVRRLADE